jgi:hypothetical protein
VVTKLSLAAKWKKREELLHRKDGLHDESFFAKLDKAREKAATHVIYQRPVESTKLFVFGDGSVLAQPFGDNHFVVKKKQFELM